MSRQPKYVYGKENPNWDEPSRANENDYDEFSDDIRDFSSEYPEDDDFYDDDYDEEDYYENDGESDYHGHAFEDISDEEVEYAKEYAQNLVSYDDDYS